MNNFTDEEKDAIESWTTNKDEYKLIKESLKDSYSANADSIYFSRAKVLLNMFNKYNDNTKNKTLYRGDILEDELGLYKNHEISMNYLLSNPIGKVLILEDTLLSFSSIKYVAVDRYRTTHKYKGIGTPTILYILNNRKSTFIDISYASHYSVEEEFLCNKGIKFMVTDIEQHENNHLVYYLDEYKS